jgi:hypothetical protein
MPARLRDLIRIARAKYGIAIDEPNSGSHFKAKKDGCRPYMLPAHNGDKTMLSDAYLKGFCRAFGLEFEELRSLL